MKKVILFLRWIETTNCNLIKIMTLQYKKEDKITGVILQQAMTKSSDKESMHNLIIISQ